MAEFVDFSVKLAVIEVLMFGDEPKLAPWSLGEALKAQGVTGDLWEYACDNYPGQVVPEARSYFEDLELPADLLAEVEELGFDGGNQVYFECSPDWDGETGQFDVARLDDLDLLPSLRRVFASGLVAEHLQDELRSRGIEVSD